MESIAKQIYEETMTESREMETKKDGFEVYIHEI